MSYLEPNPAIVNTIKIFVIAICLVALAYLVFMLKIGSVIYKKLKGVSSEDIIEVPTWKKALAIIFTLVAPGIGHIFFKQYHYTFLFFSVFFIAGHLNGFSVQFIVWLIANVHIIHAIWKLRKTSTIESTINFISSE